MSKDKPKTENQNNGVDTAMAVGQIASSIAGFWFPTIPVVASVLAAIKGWIDQRHLEERLNQINNTMFQLSLSQRSLSPDQVKKVMLKSIEDLNSHDYFAMKKSLEYVIAEAQPEVVDAFIETMLQFIYETGDKRSLAEEEMEILQNCTANVIELLRIIGKYIAVHAEGAEKDDHPEDYIQWNNFSDFAGLDHLSLTQLLVKGTTDNPVENALYRPVSMGRAFLKLTRLGVIDARFTLYPGSNATTDVTIFRPTFFGRDIIERIRVIDKTLKLKQ